MRWYTTKVDWWLGLLLLVAPLVCAVSAFVVPDDERWVGVAATLLVAAIYFGLVLPMRYAISDTHLIVRYGVVRQRIPLAKISGVQPTRNPLSSPALSLDRLAIEYGNGKSVMISPLDQSAFLDELAAKTQLRRVGRSLTR